MHQQSDNDYMNFVLKKQINIYVDFGFHVNKKKGTMYARIWFFEIIINNFCKGCLNITFHPEILPISPLIRNILSRQRQKWNKNRYTSLPKVVGTVIGSKTSSDNTFKLNWL